MVACGAPEEDPNHTRKIVNVAIDMIKSMDSLRIAKEMGVNIRIGMPVLQHIELVKLQK